jgi:hypothetical protein
MVRFVRRTLVATAIGTGAIYAGVTGLAHASAATHTTKASSTHTQRTSSSSSSTTKHLCPNEEGSNSSTNGASSSA